MKFFIVLASALLAVALAAPAPEAEADAEAKSVNVRSEKYHQIKYHESLCINFFNLISTHINVVIIL